MFTHKKSRLFRVRVDSPDPKSPEKLLEQFGGRSGELTAMLEYFVQEHQVVDETEGWPTCCLISRPRRSGTLEMIDLIDEQLTRGAGREQAYQDTLFSVMGKGPHLLNSLGRRLDRELDSPLATSWRI